ncbi:hypothetical protein ABPG77_001379 [Micractinium sp. CCAP 211/92]
MPLPLRAAPRRAGAARTAPLRAAAIAVAAAGSCCRSLQRRAHWPAAMRTRAAASGDDTLSSAYASVARRLRRGGAAPSRLGLGGRGGGASTKARWVGRLAMLATIKMVHAMLARR